MLNKPLKKIIVLFIICAIACSFLISDYNPVFKNDEFVFLSKELKNTHNEDLKSIVDIQNKIYQKSKGSPCYCEDAANYIGPYRHGYSLTKLLYILKVKLKFTPDECLKFLLLNNNFGHGNKGIKEASTFYFKKDITQLNKKEKLTLLAVFKNPGLYDPIRNKEGVKNRVQVFERVLNK